MTISIVIIWYKRILLFINMWLSQVKMKSVITILWITITLIFTNLAFADIRVDSTELESIKLQLKWTHQFQFAGYYAAKEQGYYEDVGLDVEFIERFHDMSPVSEVTSGNAEYGVGSSGLILNYSNGSPIKALAAIFQHNPLVFFSKKSSGIDHPYKMKGKRVMFDTFAEEQAPLRSLLLGSGVTPEDCIFLNHTHNLDELSNDNVDVISGYLSSAPYYYREQGLEVNIINPQDYGIDFYGDILFTSEQELKHHPDRARRFTYASLKGWRYALDHQEELVQLIHQKYHSAFSINVLRNEAKQTAKLISADTIPLGDIQQDRLYQVKEIYSQLGFIKQPTNVSITDFIFENNHYIHLTKDEQNWLDEHPSITFTGDPDGLPYEEFDNSGDYMGIVTDYLKLVEKHSGITFNVLRTDTWQESIQKILNGDVGIISATTDSALGEILNFTKPYHSSPIIIVMRNEQGYIDNIKQIADKKIGLIRDYGYSHKIVRAYPDIKFNWFNNVEQALTSVSSGKVDAVLATLAHASYKIPKLAANNIRIVGKTEFTTEIAFGVTKEYAPLISILNRAFDSISEQEKDQIFNKWGTVELIPYKNYMTIMQITFGLAILLILVLYWNKTLQQQIKARKQAETASDRNQQRFQSIFDDAPFGIGVVHSRTGKVFEVNPQFCSILGRDRSKLIKDISSWISIIHPADQEILIFNIRQIRSRKITTFDIDIRCIKPNGSIAWLRISASPLLNEKGIYTTYLCMIEDITATKAKDEVLRVLAESKSYNDDILDLIGHQLTLSTNMRFGFIATFNPQDSSKMDILAACENGTQTETFSYITKGTPSENVLKGETCYYPNTLQSLFPNDNMLVEMGVISYFGIPLFNKARKAVGVFSVLDDKPMDLNNNTMDLIQSLAVRVEIEVERQQVQGELKKLSLAVEYSPNAVMITDHKAHIEYINPKFTEITGFSSEDIIGKKPDLFELTDSNLEMWDTLMSKQEWRGEMQNKKKNGDTYWARQFVVPITNDAGDITHFVSMHEDITESKRINEEMSHRASHDMLTGLINRSEFEHRLSRVVVTAQKDFTTHALCFLDLDQFKVVNDTSGHIAGDELLRQLGTLLRSHIRQRDTLARIGGDEFAILMEHCGIDQASRAAEAVRKLIENFQFDWEGRSYHIGVSIGVALITNSTKDSTEVLKHADLACYTAKDHGRNRIHVYHNDDENQAKQESDIHWAARATEAMENDHFLLYVQPIEPLSDPNATTAYEVLLRLKDPNGDIIIPPGAFLPAVERYNLACKVDLWVIDTLFKWVAEHASQLKNIHHFSINLSGQSLGDEALLGHVVTLLNNKTLPADKITFEITETAAISNLRDATNFMTILKSHGCSFALDDFGSGLSSFAYLKNLPVEYLKIDGMFVKDIIDDPIDAAMVRSINDIGHVMNMKTIAEFVENNAIKQQLIEIGIDYAQGYGISPPFPLDELLK